MVKPLERLVREIGIWARLEHPNIAPLLGHVSTFPDICLISPWYPHGNLKQYLHFHMHCDKLKLEYDVACGLEYLHTRDPSVVHGDIKLDNILVNEEGKAVIIDFALSRYAKNTSEMMSSVRGEGNARWMAPELLAESLAKTMSGDVWSFSCIVLAAMSGKLPYSFIPEQRILRYRCIDNTTAKPASDRSAYPELPASSPLWELMFACWDDEPQKRPSMDSVRRDLAWIRHR